MSGDDLPVAASPAARRRPGLVALLYGYRAFAGLFIALPLAASLSSTTAAYPRGQGELFDPGGVMLAESVRLLRRAATPLAYAGGSSALVVLALGLLPLGMVIAGLGREGRLSAGFLVGRTWVHAGTLALLFGLGLVAEVVAAALVSMLGGKIIDALKLSAPGEDLAFVAMLTVILGVMAAIGVVRDLACVGAVHGGQRFYVATSRALRAVRRRPGRSFGGWAWRAALGTGAIAFAAWAAPALPGASGGAVLLGFALHQAGIAGSAFARASWLAAAIRVWESVETKPVAAAESVAEAAPEPVAEATPEPVAAPAPEPAAPSAPEPPEAG